PYTVRITGEGGFRLIESDAKGDSNTPRDQGQLLIRGNRISNSLEFGIVVDAGARDGSGNAPHQGPVRVTRKLNPSRLVPGVVLQNNLINRSGTGGIRMSGDPSASGQQAAAVPFGRVVNNTIVGGTVGIQVDENASPTILNNIFSRVDTGIQVDPTAAETVLGGNLFQRTITPASGIALSNTAIILSDTDPLFVNAGTGNYYLAAGSRAIDSSIDSLEDRPALVEVKSPMGIAPSPIEAPAQDLLGQLRVDDPTVSTPPGQGEVVFKDRGAIDRADFNGPIAVLVDPRDNDALGQDRDPRNTYVELTNQVLSHFSIQLFDGAEPNDPREGSGADDNTVRGNRVSVFRDGEPLLQGIDYEFHYDATNNIIRLTPLAGIWEIDHVYDIQLSNGQGLLLSAPPGNV
ncbi:MAG: right-handed parallel beta-helix repeat-containing protein, partial [Planctomycetota bacterium]